MRRSVALVALHAAGTIAFASRAASAEDAHDLFGLHPHPASEAAPSCDAPHTFGCATVTDPLDDASPYGLTTWLSASYLLRLPVADARHDGVAAYALGASRDDTGPVFGGATGLENRWTIDGAPADNLRFGGADTRIPLTFLSGIAVSAGGFTARERTSTGGTIDAQLLRGGEHHVVDAYVWSGLSANGRTRPIPPATYFTRRLALDSGPNASASIVASGPLGTPLGGRAWYAAGVAPSLASTTFNWTASRLVDRDGDLHIDGLPGVVDLEAIESTHTRSTDWIVPAMARVGFDRGPHHLELSMVGHVSNTARYLGNATMQAAGVDRVDLIGDAIATWHGRWRSTRAMVQLAWHRSDHRESARDPAAANIPQLLSAYIPATLPEDPELAARCADMTYPGIAQCPVPLGYFASAGAGPLVDLTGDRPSATAELAHRIGSNVVRAGATLEDARLVTSSRFTGGELDRSLFDGHLDRERYVGGPCQDVVGAPCAYTATSALTYRTRYTAAYVEDTFSPTRDIRVDGGLRWELMWVGPRLHFSNELSPRVGLSWDVLGGGKSRVWASMGRSFALLPAGLGPTVIRRDAIVHDTVTPLGMTRATDGGSAFRVVPGVAPMGQDELTAGIEVGLARTFLVTAWIQGRYLERGLETTEDGFDNPGRDGGLPATRASEQVALEVSTSPTGKLTLRAGYLAGRTFGSYAGPYDPRLGITLYDGAAYDTPFSTGNAIGDLPTSVGHRVYIEADRRGTLGPVAVGVATRLTVSSGHPRTAYADTDVGVVPLVPVGGLGRGPMLSQANVRLSASWRGFDATLDVFNVFDRTETTGIDELYASGVVRPIEGGSYEDLVFLKSTDGSPSRRRAAYGLATTFQSPVSAVLGVHRAF